MKSLGSFSENVVVGAGITGIASAIQLINKNREVKIYEITDTLGGILKDYEKNGEVYFNSCQYINSNSDWAQLLFSELKDELIEFNHKYGSYTDIYGYEKISKTFAGITLHTSNSFEISDLPINSLSDRISIYPEEIGSPIKEWLQRMKIDPNIISPDGAIGLQLSKVFIDNNIEEIAKKKLESNIYDEIYGLPRNVINLPVEKCFLPKNGYNKLFKKIENLLKDYGVKISYNSPVVPLWSGSKLSLKIKNNPEEAIKIIWTCNPTALIKFYNKKKIDSITVKMNVIVADLDCNYVEPYYIQVYSKKINITRIFIYQIGNKSKITIESFEEDRSNQEVISFAQKILYKHDLNITIKVEAISKYHQKRYFLTSLHDKEIFNNFYKGTEETNLICGKWDSYGRDEKIQYINNQLNKI